MRQRGQDIGKHHRDLPAEQVIERRAGSAIGNVLDIGACHLIEQNAGQVRRGAVARRGIAQLARVCAGVRDQRLQIGRRHCGVHRQHIGQVADPHDRREALLRIVGLVRVKADVDRQWPGCTEKNRVAVGLRAGDKLGADVAARACLVLDHDRLAQLRLQALGQPACQRIGRPARRKRHHQRDRARRKIGRGKGRGQCCTRRKACCGHGALDQLPSIHALSPSLSWAGTLVAVAWVDTTVFQIDCASQSHNS